MKLNIPISLTKYLLWIALPVMTCTCGDNRQKGNERLIFTIAMLIESAPDSALTLLNTIDTGQLNQRNEACYQILKVRAKDKRGGNISLDTAVFQARDYLVNSNDELAGLACFVSAIVNEVQAKPGKALYDYLMAYQLSQGSDDHLLNGYICYNLARIFYNHRIYSESIPYARKAVRYDELAGVQGESKVFTLEILAFNHFGLQEMDSALIYLHKALKLAEHKATRYRIYQAIAQTYHTTKVFPLAKEMYQHSLANATDNVSIGRCYLGFAGVYDEMRQDDSASYYIHKAKWLLANSNSFPVLQEIYRLQSTIKSTRDGTLSYQQVYALFPVFREYFDAENILLEQSRYLKGVIQTAQDDRNNLALERKLHFFITLSAVLALLVVVLFFLWQRKRSNASLDAERRLHRKKLQQYEARMSQERQRYEERIANLQQTMRDDCRSYLSIIEPMGKLREAVFNVKKNKERVPALVQQEVSNVLEAYHWNRLYPTINSSLNGLVDTFMAELTELDEKHRRACCIAYLGLSSKAIAIVMGDVLSTAMNRLWKIRNTFGIGVRGNIPHYLNQRFGIPDDSPPELPEDEDE